MDKLIYGKGQLIEANTQTNKKNNKKKTSKLK